MNMKNWNVIMTNRLQFDKLTWLYWDTLNPKPKPLGQSIFKYLSFKRGRIFCLLFKSRRDLTPMSLHLLFRNGNDLMSIYKHQVSLAPKQFLLLPPSIYLCLGLWSGLHCALECCIPMGGGHFQNMWDSAVTSF